MKNITAQMASWDDNEDRIRMLHWARNVFLAPKLAKSVELLSVECGLDDATKAAKESWLALQRELGPRATADVLLYLRSLGALIGDFVEAYESHEGGSVERALAILNPRKAKPSSGTLPVDWLN